MSKLTVLVMAPRQRMTVDGGFLSLPTYRSIKIVKAAKITDIEKDGINRVNTLSLDALGRVFKLDVNDGWFYKHEPQVGGYVVVYEDGYCSYSPSVPFEKGHIRIDTPTAEPDRSNHAMLRREVQALANLLLGRTASGPLPSPEQAGQLLLNAIAMYGEPEPSTGTSGHVSALSQKELMKANGFEPNDKLVFDSLVSVTSAGANTFGTVQVDPDPNVENEFYNWAMAHKLTHEGKPNLATVMQAFDEMVMQCDELIKQDNLLAGRNMTHAEVSVLMERARQVTSEGYTEKQDDKYERNELLGAAICYLQHDVFSLTQGTVPAAWPWAPAAWKPKDYRRNLVRAAALILAELDRVDRKNAGKVG